MGGKVQKFEADIGPSRILTEFVPDFNIMLYFETRVAEMHAMLKIQAKFRIVPPLKISKGGERKIVQKYRLLKASVQWKFHQQTLNPSDILWAAFIVSFTTMIDVYDGIHLFNF